MFIVRVWFETREIEGASVRGRGVIEHVPTSQRRYFRNLSDMTAFVGSFLGDPGISSERADG